jgi:hypothetical protein
LAACAYLLQLPPFKVVPPASMASTHGFRSYWPAG